MSYNPDEVREKLQALAQQKVEFHKYLKYQGYIFKLVETENGYINYWAIHPDYYDRWLKDKNSCPREAVILLD